MPKPEPTLRGQALAARLRDACACAAHAPRAGARDLPVLAGITPKSVFIEPLENVSARATEILVASGRVYAFGQSVVIELLDGDRRRLLALSQGGHVERFAAAVIANLFVCESAAPDRDPVQFAPQPMFVQVLLNSEAFRAALPPIRRYVTRPLFDDDFNLLPPGYHPSQGVLVHGPAIEPILSDDPRPGSPAIDRLPHHLHTLLAGFCFTGDADLANAVAFLLTVMLVDRFVAVGKPIALIDGNQPGLGKTLLGRVIGILMDGVDPAVIGFTTDDEELGKKVCATLRQGQSLVLIDNAKVRGGDRVDSRFIEANSMAPRIALRILGQSANFERPNDVIWALTMNDTKASPDLVSRGVPIRLSHDGDPRLRAFPGPDPVAYALEHRAGILDELAGMVVRWNQLGRRTGGRAPLRRLGPDDRRHPRIRRPRGVPHQPRRRRHQVRPGPRRAGGAGRGRRRLRRTGGRRRQHHSPGMIHESPNAQGILGSSGGRVGAPISSGRRPRRQARGGQESAGEGDAHRQLPQGLPGPRGFHRG